jgi:hypothetical protein
LTGTYPQDSVIMSQATGNIWTQTANGLLSLGLRVYATQANLTADTPVDGTLGFAVDTGGFSVRTGGVWATLAHQGVNTGSAAPTTPVAGNLWMDTSATEPSLKFYTGAAWLEAGGKQITVGPLSQRPNPMEDGSIYMESDNVHAIWAKQPGRSPMLLNQGTLINHAENLSVTSADSFDMRDFHTVEVDLVLHAGADTGLFLTINESSPTANGGSFHHQTVYGNGGGWRDTQANGQFGGSGIFIGLCSCKSQWPAFVRMTLTSPRRTNDIPPTVFCTGYNISKDDNFVRVWTSIMKFPTEFGRFETVRFSSYSGQNHHWLYTAYGYL